MKESIEETQSLYREIFTIVVHEALTSGPKTRLELDAAVQDMLNRSIEEVAKTRPTNIARPIVHELLNYHHKKLFSIFFDTLLVSDLVIDLGDGRFAKKAVPKVTHDNISPGSKPFDLAASFKRITEMGKAYVALNSTYRLFGKLDADRMIEIFSSLHMSQRGIAATILALREHNLLVPKLGVEVTSPEDLQVLSTEQVPPWEVLLTKIPKHHRNDPNSLKRFRLMWFFFSHIQVLRFDSMEAVRDYVANHANGHDIDLPEDVAFPVSCGVFPSIHEAELHMADF